jgi:hypothetical protein
MRGIVLVIGLIATGFWTSTTSAQDLELQQMRACTLVQDNVARLRCYDGALSRPAAEAPLVVIPKSSTGATSEAPLFITPLVARPQSPITPKFETSKFFHAIVGNIAPSTGTKGERWQLKADKAVLEDASQLLGTLVSADGQATLALTCKAMSTGAYVSTYSFLGWESMRVVYRINDNPATETRWAASPDGRGAVSNNAIEFISALTDNGTLLVSVFDYNGTNHDLRFNLGPVSDLRSRIATVCQWPTAFSNDKAVLNEPTANPQYSKQKPRAPRPPNAN